MVGQGIAFNVEQRAFLQAISTTIADTFRATDQTLLRLVRIQQQDTTAARLGMESALTAFLNNMYETTEYMTEQAASIRSSLYEASALMGAASATGFEFQVQKWLGSLYSVGFSQASGLAGALGKLAAGDISGITGGGAGNLLVMAANKANLSVSDLLAKGMDESQTNQLMQAMVNYLAEIYGETRGSNVLAQQFAGVFGLSASDLKAAANLARSTKTVAANNLDYGGMLGRLNYMAGSMGSRMSLGQMGSNAFENFKYGISAGIANSPILYSIYKIGSLVQDTVGGIGIPSIGPVDLNTTVANLMMAGALGTSLIGGIGSMVGGLFSSGNNLLSKFGVGKGSYVTRGTGMGYTATGISGLSESGYVGNTAGGDIQSKVLTDANDEANQQVASAVDESEETTIKMVNESVINIYNLLQNITNGTQALHVTFSDQSSIWGR